MLWIWSTEAAHWDALFLRSYNFGQNHLGNFPLLIYSAYGDLVNHAKNASHLYSHFRFFPNPCHINHLTWSSSVSWEVGRKGNGIYTLQMRKVNPREVKQLAWGHAVPVTSRTWPGPRLPGPRPLVPHPSHQGPALHRPGPFVWNVGLRAPCSLEACRGLKEHVFLRGQEGLVASHCYFLLCPCHIA